MQALSKGRQKHLSTRKFDLLYFSKSFPLCFIEYQIPLEYVQTIIFLKNSFSRRVILKFKKLQTPGTILQE